LKFYPTLPARVTRYGGHLLVPAYIHVGTGHTHDVNLLDKRLAPRGSLSAFLQTLSVNMFEKKPISQALQRKRCTTSELTESNRMIPLES